MIKVCFRCDGKGHKMLFVADHLNFNVIGWVCPKCNFILVGNKKTKGIMTIDDQPQTSEGR